MVGKPPHAMPPQPSARHAALQQAVQALQGGRIAEAERIAREILTRHPGEAQAAQVYGHALYVQGRGADAIAPLERAAQQNRDPVLETQLAMALRQAGRIDDALARFAQAIRRDRPFPPALLEYGALLIDLGRYAQAVDILQRGAALAPNFPDLLLRLGSALAHAGRQAEAEIVFGRVLPLLPNSIEMLFNAAVLMRNARAFASAAQVYRRILSLDGKNNDALIGLGVSLVESGAGDEGRKALRTAGAAGARAQGQVVNALASAGHGRFFLRPSAAARFFADGV